MKVHQSSSATESFMSGLPSPEPLPTAIEGGVFGVEISGPIIPDTGEIEALTEEHALEMSVLLLDVTYVERCQAAGTVPESGRRPRNDEQRERLTSRLTKELAHMRDKYEQCVDLYEQAFGAAAACQLDHWVRTSCQVSDSAETPTRQISLFDWL